MSGFLCAQEARSIYLADRLSHTFLQRAARVERRLRHHMMTPQTDTKCNACGFAGRIESQCTPHPTPLDASWGATALQVGLERRFIHQALRPISV
ncbi:MAG: hypothetical protein M3453_02260, partial [Pseudomonadota bacterium]|nr:hypothetical protein [Pseudomonadota bacterium]